MIGGFVYDALPVHVEFGCGSVAGLGDAGAVHDLNTAIGAKRKLSEIGMKEEDLGRAAELAVRNPYTNPKPVTKAGIRRLPGDAFFGRRPAN